MYRDSLFIIYYREEHLRTHIALHAFSSRRSALTNSIFMLFHARMSRYNDSFEDIHELVASSLHFAALCIF